MQQGMTHAVEVGALAMLLIASVAGAFGSGVILAGYTIHRKQILFPIAFAHLFIGLVSGELWYLWNNVEMARPFQDIIIESFLAGAICSLSAAAVMTIGSLILKVWLEHKGFVIRISIDSKENGK